MRTTLLIAIISILTFASCDNSKQLATDIQGTWSGAPDRLDDNNASTSSIVETYTFTRASDNVSQGDVSLTALVSVTAQVTSSDAIVMPFSFTAAATASIMGRWKAVSDSQVQFDWNDSTLTVSVDPRGVMISSDMLTGGTTAQTDSIRPQLAESIRAQIARSVEVRFLSVRDFKDINIKNNIMTFDCNKSHLTMQRQNQ